jgi:2-keto-4-pentenoate hydratase/2-oxohepta-3-ene-1,7-dioic acid hydratase in catechol pathway
MKVATYRWGGRRQVGLLSDDESEVTPLALDDHAEAVGGLALIEHMAQGHALPKSGGVRLPLAAIVLEAPLPRPRRNLFCVGRNYRAHARELAGSVFQTEDTNRDTWPIIFTKVPDCVIATGEAIKLPQGISDQIDYEAELAVVIGRGGRNIRASRAMEHVWGYTIVNDVTARDVQMRHNQWDLGKSFDTFCPMGPWLASTNVCDGTKMRLRWVNGELRQDASTTDLIFDIPTLIETCSRGITLYPGDVIATGTPAGVGMGMKPPVFLKSGDVVRIDIDGIGSLENPIQ